MTIKEFETVVNQELDYCKGLLTSKGIDYNAMNDRLKHFKDAASFMEVTPSQALLGQLMKHLVSLKEMIIKEAWGDISITFEKWREKISDSINYLLLLYAIIVEEKAENAAKRTQAIDSNI